jgi:hypothetical protein
MNRYLLGGCFYRAEDKNGKENILYKIWVKTDQTIVFTGRKEFVINKNCNQNLDLYL